MALVMPPRSVPVQRPYPPGTPGAEGPTEPIFKVSSILIVGGTITRELELPPWCPKELGTSTEC